jgi:chromosome segregation ATPase
MQAMAERNELQAVLDGLGGGAVQPAACATSNYLSRITRCDGATQAHGQRQEFASRDAQSNFELLTTRIMEITQLQHEVEKEAEDNRTRENDLLRQRAQTEVDIRRLQQEIESLRRQMADRARQIEDLSKRIEEIKKQTIEFDRKHVVVEEKLEKADRIEEWRLQKLLKRLETKQQVR